MLIRIVFSCLTMFFILSLISCVSQPEDLNLLLQRKQIYNILHKVNSGTNRAGDLQKAEELGRTIKSTCVCGLGMTAANPLQTFLHNLNPN